MQFVDVQAWGETVSNSQIQSRCPRLCSFCVSRLSLNKKNVVRRAMLTSSNNPWSLLSDRHVDRLEITRNSQEVLSSQLRETASLAWWLRRPPRKPKIPGLNLAYARIFPGSSQNSDFKIDTSVATLPGAWSYRDSAGTGRPGVSIL